jgi:8-oxo-dGTP diphosphatase
LDEWTFAGAACFGERLPGVEYRVRPGAYAVITAADGALAVLATPQGCFLPGGGGEAGESPAATLGREVREECGAAISIKDLLGAAIEWLYAPAEETYFEIRSLFFRAAFTEQPGAGGEDDHALVWLSPAAAIERLRRPAQRWAVGRLAPGLLPLLLGFTLLVSP